MSLPVCGIDPSLTSTGICLGTTNNQWDCCAIKSAPSGDNVAKRMKRCESIIERIVAELDSTRPKLILVEAYAFASAKGTPSFRYELGGLIRWHLIDYTPHVIEVAPTTLKKFVTGVGKGDKAVMQAHIQKTWGQIFETDDQADAFALFQMALCIVGRQKPRNEAQREAVAKVLSGHSATAEQITEFCESESEKPF